MFILSTSVMIARDKPQPTKMSENNDKSDENDRDYDVIFKPHFDEIRQCKDPDMNQLSWKTTQS